MLTLFVHECDVLVVTVNPSTVQHAAAGLRCFATRQFWKEETIGHYYGTFFYKNLSGETGQDVNGERIVFVTKAEYCTRALELQNNVRSADDNSHFVWTVPDKLNAKKFINDPRVVP